MGSNPQEGASQREEGEAPVTQPGHTPAPAIRGSPGSHTSEAADKGILSCQSFQLLLQNSLPVNILLLWKLHQLSFSPHLPLSQPSAYCRNSTVPAECLNFLWHSNSKPPPPSDQSPETWTLNLSQGSVQFGSVAQSCPTPRGLLKLMSIELVMPSNHLILCRTLLLLPSIFPSIRVFSNESALQIRWPTYWSFIFSISPSNEYSALIFFSMDWLDLLAVQGTLKTLLQQLNHSSKASILQCSAFFIAQLSHPYMTTGKTIALTRQTLAGKVMSLLVNMLSRLVIAFLPRSKLF